MLRKIPWIFFFLMLAIITAWLTQLKLRTPTAEHATVYFNQPLENISEGSTQPVTSMKGLVSKKDKYVTVKSDSDQNEYEFTWEQIRNISGSRGEDSKRVDEAIELIEFLSRLGIIAAIVVFSVGLIQYYQGQKWEREKFLLAAMNEFSNSKLAGNARLILDSLSLYDGTNLKLAYDKDGTDLEFVSNEDIRKSLALNYKPDKTILNSANTSPEKKRETMLLHVRECFDSFFNFLERFDHYIATGLVKKRSVYTHLNYPIDMLGKTRKLGEDNKLLSEDDRMLLLRYARHYDFPHVRFLIGRWNRWHRFRQWLRSIKPASRASKASGADAHGREEHYPPPPPPPAESEISAPPVVSAQSPDEEGAKPTAATNEQHPESTEKKDLR
ncbi:MAG: hypothetical protein WCD76_10920 [Pyrinomonadaceae bacterium]